MLQPFCKTVRCKLLAYAHLSLVAVDRVMPWNAHSFQSYSPRLIAKQSYGIHTDGQACMCALQAELEHHRCKLYVSTLLVRIPGIEMVTATFVAMSQRLGRQNRQEGQMGGNWGSASHATCPRHLQTGSMMPHTRLRCVSFQAAGAPAPGRQEKSKDQSIASRPILSKDASSTGQHSRSAPGTPKQTVPGEPRGAVQEASYSAVAAKQQHAERMQAAEEASTSGREYWQVMRPSLVCYIRSFPFRPLVMRFSVS